MENNKIGIKITNKGAAIGVEMRGNFLIQLLNFKRFTRVETLDELKQEALKDMDKQLKWLDRKDDKTLTTEEKKFVIKNAKECKSIIKKLWNKMDM